MAKKKTSKSIQMHKDTPEYVLTETFLDVVRALELLARRVNAGGQARRATADNHQIIHHGTRCLFGGQAAATAADFAGRLKQMSNAAGDVSEQIGFLITKNKFFNEAVQAGTTFLADLAVKIEENRGALINLAKSGIVSVIDGLGWVIETLRFF